MNDDTFSTTLSTIGTSECGATRVEKEMAKGFLDPSVEVESIRLYRCAREYGHEGEHVGEEVQPQTDWTVWS